MQFKLGDRVELTAQALGMKLDGRKHGRTGIVTALHTPYISVRRDGYSATEKWNPEFWQLEKRKSEL